MQEYMSYTDSDILERVDEYSLFCHYLEFEPLLGRKYSSPLRSGDNDPSFGIFERKNKCMLPNEYMWKDQAHPVKQHGDIFDLVQLLYNLSSRVKACWKICSDFGLGGCQSSIHSKLVYKEIRYFAATNIKIVSRPFSLQDLSYWDQYGISQEILNRYNVSSIKAYWLHEEDKFPSYPNGLGYAYRINSRYQLYFPKAQKRRKFKNNWNYSNVPGLQQLEYNSKMLIITKAMKDVMCLRSMGYEAIAPRGEGILLPAECIEYVKRKYRNIVVLFDNDNKHRGNEYPFPRIELPLEDGKKDITDYYAHYGRENTSLVLKQLLYECIQQQASV